MKPTGAPSSRSGFSGRSVNSATRTSPRITAWMMPPEPSKKRTSLALSFSAASVMPLSSQNATICWIDTERHGGFMPTLPFHFGSKRSIQSLGASAGLTRLLFQMIASRACWSVKAMLLSLSSGAKFGSSGGVHCAAQPCFSPSSMRSSGKVMSTSAMWRPAVYSVWKRSISGFEPRRMCSVWMPG